MRLDWFSRHLGLSLRVKMTAAFVALVLGGVAVSTFLGSRIVTGAMREEALKRVRHGLETARMMYLMRLERVRRSVVRCASREELELAEAPRPAPHISRALAQAQAENVLDFAGFVSTEGWAIAAGSARMLDRAELDRSALGPRVAAALAGATETTTEVLPPGLLRQHSATLAQQAYLPVVPVPRASPRPPGEAGQGLVMLTVAPVVVGSRRVGAVYGGVLLNGNHELVDQIQQAVFGGEKHDGVDAGTSTLFLGDVRVSTNVMSAPGVRAVGTRASAEVAESVLGSGRRWLDRAFVVNDWYLSAYEPVVNGAEQRIGMLYVGVLEAPYLAVRTRMMLSFLLVAAVGVLVAVALIYVIARAMIGPLEEMVAAANRIADGDLDQPVGVRSGDEIGRLARSFNRMQAGLRSAREELEQWAHTLERRVAERTAELAAVQGQMAQAEKLASLGRMAAGIAHEVNNPLGGIMTFAMLAQEDCPPDHPLRRNLDIIASQTLRCREIVKGLLEFSRQSASQECATDVRAVVERTLSLMQQQASFLDIRTVLRFSEEDLPLVLVDPGQLQQVVMNLVLNAVDAMDECGELTVETLADRSAAEVVLRVHDTGKGIPAEIQPFIFDPFFTTKEVGRGTGLGLAIVHGIVSRAHGTIEVSSTAGEGTTFTIRLPALLAEDGKRGAQGVAQPSD